MGFRYRRSVRLIPGVKLNFSSSGTSVSFGGRGFWYTVGPNGKRRTTISAPGTGLSWTEEHRIRKPGPHAAIATAKDVAAAALPQHAAPQGRPTWAFLAIVAIVIIIVLGIFQAFQQATNQAAQVARPNTSIKAHSAQNTGGGAAPNYQSGAASVKVMVPAPAPTAPPKGVTANVAVKTAVDKDPVASIKDPALRAIVRKQPASANDTTPSYEISLAIVDVAVRGCPGLFANEARMTLLRRVANISEGEAKASPLFAHIRATTREQIARTGRIRWCSAATASFGPGGLQIPGLLEFR